MHPAKNERDRPRPQNHQSSKPPPYSASSSNSSPIQSDSPVRVVYDETFRGKSYMQPSIMSMAAVPHIKAYLEHHSPDTDGTFTICIANGIGIFVSMVLPQTVAFKPTSVCIDS